MQVVRKKIRIFKQMKKVAEKIKKKQCDLKCYFLARGYGFNITLRDIGLQHLKSGVFHIHIKV